MKKEVPIPYVGDTMMAGIRPQNRIRGFIVETAGVYDIGDYIGIGTKPNFFQMKNSGRDVAYYRIEYLLGYYRCILIEKM